MVVLNVTTSASMLQCCVSQSKLTAVIRCWPFSHTPMVTLRASLYVLLLHHPQEAYSCDPLLAFVHALMVVLYVITSASKLHCFISQSKLTAVIRCWHARRG